MRHVMSPIQQYKASDGRERHSMFKHKDFISYSPSQAAMGVNPLIGKAHKGGGMQSQNFGVLDRLRVSQQMIE